MRKHFTIDLYFKVTQFLQYKTFATTRNAFDPVDFIAECVALRNKKTKFDLTMKTKLKFRLREISEYFDQDVKPFQLWQFTA